jgi:hypothetical protein
MYSAKKIQFEKKRRGEKNFEKKKKKNLGEGQREKLG